MAQPTSFMPANLQYWTSAWSIGIRDGKPCHILLVAKSRAERRSGVEIAIPTADVLGKKRHEHAAIIAPKLAEALQTLGLVQLPAADAANDPT